jgi:hypothetical protein
MNLEVFSSLGKLVHSAGYPWHVAGFQNEILQWDARNQATGTRVKAGVYVFRLTLQSESGSVAQYADQIVVLRP